MCRWSEPWVRVEATNRARPVAASQAENASMRSGRRVADVVWVWMGHMERAMYMDSIMLSRHSRAEIKCVRWKARPRLLRVKAEKKLNCRADIKKVIGCEL